jgi:hypothetical protein
VEKTNEIPKMIKILKNHFDESCTSTELDLLMSKVASTEQILRDY